VARVVAAVGQIFDVEGIHADQQWPNHLLGIDLDLGGILIRRALADTDQTLIGKDLGDGTVRFPHLIATTTPQIAVGIDIRQGQHPHVGDR
jgi:hypothetical protein